MDFCCESFSFKDWGILWVSVMRAADYLVIFYTSQFPRVPPGVYVWLALPQSTITLRATGVISQAAEDAVYLSVNRLYTSGELQVQIFHPTIQIPVLWFSHSDKPKQIKWGYYTLSPI